MSEQPEALHLANLQDEWARMNGETERGSRTLVANELRRQHARIAELEAELVKEAARTAEQKLRADQMSQQHSTQAALNSEARSELAAVKAELAKAREVPEMPKPVMYALFDNLGFYEACETEIACKSFCDHYNARDEKLGMEGLAPYTYQALFTGDQVRAMFERNKG